jgi:cardiolipin synthase
MIGTLFLVALLCFLLLLTKQYVLRGTAIRRIRALEGEAGPPAAGTAPFLDLYSILTETQLSEGSRAELLLNGDELFPRLWDDLRRAEHSIAFQVFWVRPGSLADQLRDILAERARAGVRVRVLLDYFGAYGLGERYVESLTSSGVEVAVYRPLRWGTLYKVQQRSHVRAVVVDTRIGYTGGFGIDDRWRGDGRHPDHWRDTHVRVEGRVAALLQAAFVTNWAEATGDLLLGSYAAPPGEGPGSSVAVAGITFASPSLGSTTAGRAFFLSIACAGQRLYVTNAYFVPDRKSAYYAGRAHYEELLRAGVRIYEYGPTMVHAKTMVVDGVWSLVGTINFDTRSMALNEEVSLVVSDERFGARLEEVFLADLAHAGEVTLAAVRARSAVDRLKERAAQLVAPLL